MFKKIWLLPLAVMICVIGTLQAEESDKEFPYIGEIFDLNEDYHVRVNLRAGDGINYRILTVSIEGQELIVVGKRGGWTQIKMPEGSEFPAWVKTTFLSISDNTATVNGSDVNLRADRSTKSQSLLSLQKGQKLTIIKKDGTWAKVKAPAETKCWISSKYVKFKKPVSETFIASETKESAGAVQEEVLKRSESSITKKVTDGSVANKGRPSEKKEILTKGDSPEKASPNDRLTKIRADYEKKLKDKKAKEAEKYSGLEIAMNKYLTVGLVVSEKITKTKAIHKLEFKQRIKYYLKSAVSKDDAKKILFDLNEFSGKMVGVDGRVVLQDDGTRLIEVEKIVVLDSPK